MLQGVGDVGHNLGREGREVTPHPWVTHGSPMISAGLATIIPAPSANGVHTKITKETMWYHPIPISLMISGKRCDVSSFDPGLLISKVTCDPGASKETTKECGRIESGAETMKQPVPYSALQSLTEPYSALCCGKERLHFGFRHETTDISDCGMWGILWGCGSSSSQRDCAFSGLDKDILHATGCLEIRKMKKTTGL